MKLAYDLSEALTLFLLVYRSVSRVLVVSLASFSFEEINVNIASGKYIRRCFVEMRSVWRLHWDSFIKRTKENKENHQKIAKILMFHYHVSQ